MRPDAIGGRHVALGVGLGRVVVTLNQLCDAFASNAADAAGIDAVVIRSATPRCPTPASAPTRSAGCPSTACPATRATHPVLCYDNHKGARNGRRLPIGGPTAELITGQQQRVRARFPPPPSPSWRCCPR